MKLNGIVLEAGSTIVELTDWDNRLGSYSEGDWAVWSSTGAAYRWSTALRGGDGDWVRQECYETGSVFSSYCWFDGNEANDAELLSKGWTATGVAGSGIVGYEGDKIKFTALGSAGSDQAGPIQTPSSITSKSSVWAAGEYAANQTTNSWEFRLFNFRDGAYHVRFSHNNTYNRVVRTNGVGVGALGQQALPDSVGQFVGTDFKHFAFHASPYVAGGTVGKISCWVDHSLEPYYFGPRTLVSDGSATFIRAANASDLSSSNTSYGCVFFGKNFTCGGNLNS